MGQCQRCNGPNLSLGYDETNPQCHACFLGMKECKKETDGCLKKAEQKEIYKRVLEYGKKNIIGKVEYTDKAFNRKTAILTRQSIVHSLEYGELFYAKVDVLNNISEYLKDIKNIKEVPVEHNEKGNIAKMYEAKVKYKGDNQFGKDRDMLLQFKEYDNGLLIFYFVKFI